MYWTSDTFLAIRPTSFKNISFLFFLHFEKYQAIQIFTVKASLHCKPWTHLKHSSLFAIFSFIYRVWWLKFLSFNIFPSFPHLRILFISDLQNWDWKLCKNSNPGESGLDQEKFLHYPGYQICWKQKIKGWIRCSSNKSLICQFSVVFF